MTTVVGYRLLKAIRLRDPFVLPVRREGLYYLYGSTDPNTWKGPGIGFEAYRSSDLEQWEGPFRAFTPPEGFWGTENFWSPEVHELAGRFIMSATFRGKAGRGVAILASDHPLGPFLPHSDGAVTPGGWDALDGTLFVDDEGGYWLVFCHEWQQSVDGRVCACRLSKDLRTRVGDPVTLFAASQAPWSRPLKQGCYVADGPFLHRSVNGSLLMLWSSFGSFGYCQGVARSATRGLLGRWDHDEAPLWEADGGHGMTFRTFGDELKLILHHPNQTPYERALLLDAVERGDGLRLKRQLLPLAVVIRRFNRGGSRRQKLRFLLRFVLCRVRI
jgi:hypothetical protein